MCSVTSLFHFPFFECFHFFSLFSFCVCRFLSYIYPFSLCEKAVKSTILGSTTTQKRKKKNRKTAVNCEEKGMVGVEKREKRRVPRKRKSRRKARKNSCRLVFLPSFLDQKVKKKNWNSSEYCFQILFFPSYLFSSRKTF